MSLLLLLLATAQAEPRCTYAATVYNAVARQTSRTIAVDKARSAVTAEEIGPLGCTPCEEDQARVPLTAGLQVQLCKQALPSALPALARAVEAGARIETITGYRPSYSRGQPNAHGDRTQLSSHAFGIAIDLNEAHNGLYEACPTWGPSCLLRKGGPWVPGSPLSLGPDHPLVRALEAAGWSWAGRLAGDQKDFMHFSLGGEGPSLPQ